MSKISKIWLGVGATLLIVFLLIANSFVGNPFSKIIAQKAIDKHVQENYGDFNLEVSKVIYNFKLDAYVAHAKSKTSEDTFFAVYYNKDGIRDDYKNNVLGKWNTYIRLCEEYDKVVTKILEETTYKFDIKIGDLNKASEEIQDILTLNMPFDLQTLPLEQSVIAYLYYDDFSWDNVARITLELDEILEKRGLEVKKYTVVLTHEPTEKEKNYDSMGIYDFPKELLEKENLPQVMEEFYKDWNQKNSELKK